MIEITNRPLQIKKPTSILWRRWVVANALSEAFGLGLTLLLTGLIFAQTETIAGLGAIVLAFIGAVTAGLLEATLVGLAQWWAMHPWFPAISRGKWWLGTLAGVLLAYVLGYLPSTLLDISSAASGEAVMVEPPQTVILLLAAVLGAVAGAILSFAQWLVMRGRVKRAGWWIPANMLAWAVGMPIIFAAIDIAFGFSQPWQGLLFGFLALLVTGAVVGAIHGAFLIRLVDDSAGD